ncbi:MAG: hypothetical protein A3I68_06715 [Candidatus Melainabacteria bacterium RIFCSPLOWO2_02_FULL_35_15]|nr:MAG: hypothetical protein A3F80_04215 [Candidatus Melainabacteria bacterium RIFCSPLOWO2_12_FULL_35_11]OGI13490.1 MAG: hypothetical protein A3I68_06715 [Candidatus Melainabacteria bacterium RIFCSPLOWO2_02_FULL_35_15]
MNIYNEKNPSDNTFEDEYDMDSILAYQKLSVSKKLEYLDEMNDFFSKLTPEKNKKAWLKLKEEGY